MDFLKELIFKMFPGAAGLALGKYIDDINRKNSFTPEEAVANATGRRDAFQSSVTGQPGGIPGVGTPPGITAPNTTQGKIGFDPFNGGRYTTPLGAVKQQQPFTPPTQSAQPELFRGNAPSQGGGAEELIKMLLQKASGGMNSTQNDAGRQNLQTSLDNRFRPRPSGQATATRL